MVGAIYLAILRLRVINPVLRRGVLDILFIILIALLAVILWHIIDIISNSYRRHIAANDKADMEPVIVFATRGARLLMAGGLFAFILTHFGINVAALSAAVGLGGLAISLAARDAIADAIAGVILLVDRPFRVGDRIEIEKATPGATSPTSGCAPPASAPATTGSSSSPTP